MLETAGRRAGAFSATAGTSHNPFAIPNPRAAIERASVWFTAYPMSMITRPGSSFLSTLGDPQLWQAFQTIGIDAVHTGPVKRAGGLSGVEATPSVDGYFDRISSDIDEVFGTEDEFRRLCEVAGRHDGAVIDDIVPGHPGKGADFRLAEMKVGDYPGIYHMVEIPPHDWHLLPEVPAGRDSVNVSVPAEDRLMRAGYILGPLQRVLFYQAGIKETNWSATAAVRGPDGVERRPRARAGPPTPTLPRTSRRRPAGAPGGRARGGACPVARPPTAPGPARSGAARRRAPSRWRKGGGGAAGGPGPGRLGRGSP